MSNDGMIKAVIFDLDDTLMSEYEFVKSGYHYMSERLASRLSHTPEEVEARLWELSRETYSRAFNRLFDSYGEKYSEEELQELIIAYRDHPADMSFYGDAPETLRALKERGILTGIISDGDPKRQKNKLKSAVRIMDGDPEASFEDAHRWFDEIILTDEFGGTKYRKPDPRGFKEIAERLGVNPSEMIYVGDNPAKDFHIAADLPVRTARIIRENGIYHNREYLDDIHETWRIESLKDIVSIVDEHGGSGLHKS
ncbi:MAG: HAD-IA family hydrolase [Lachnospiraceae bacterium]|nr:HAD-IA family hydrolase [Lachnospiraceae bacterium]